MWCAALLQVLRTVRQTLQDLKLAIEGTIIMSATLKETLDAMYDARLPERWRKVTLYTCLNLSKQLVYCQVLWGSILWSDRV